MSIFAIVHMQIELYACSVPAALHRPSLPSHAE